MRITTEMIMARRPCPDYTEDRIKELIGDGKTLLEICDGDIPVKDRIWVITRFLPDLETRKFAIYCARRANRNNILEITAYIDAIEAYYITGSGTEDQMHAADRVADWVADWVAYRAADLAADWAAYMAADLAADWVADWAADRAAERNAQIEYLRCALGKGE